MASARSDYTPNEALLKELERLDREAANIPESKRRQFLAIFAPLAPKPANENRAP